MESGAILEMVTDAAAALAANMIVSVSLSVKNREWMAISSISFEGKLIRFTQKFGRHAGAEITCPWQHLLAIKIREADD
jgi:hypothetical protein